MIMKPKPPEQVTLSFSIASMKFVEKSRHSTGLGRESEPCT